MSTQDAADVTINSLTFDGKTMHVDVASAMVSADTHRSIDEAPTLNLSFHDPYQKLVTKGLFAEKLTAQLDGRSFEVVRLNKNGPSLNVTLEALAVAEMRRHTDPVKVEANSMTRFDFAVKLLNEIGWIPIYMSPGATLETTKVQLARGVVASASADSGQVQADYFDQKTGTIVSGGTSTTLTGVQVARVAAQAGFTGNDLTIAVAVAKAESKWSAIADNTGTNKNGSTDYGLWQINSVHGALLAKYNNNWKDPLVNAKMAFEIYNGKGRKFTDWVTYNSGAYKAYMTEAAAATGDISSLQADTGAGVSTPVGKLTASQKDKLAAQALLGGAEDTWTCIKRIFADINWRAYVDFDSQNRAAVFVGPDSGFTSNPAEINITEDSPGVDTIDYDFDLQKATATGTIFCRSHRWQLPPGTQINLPTTGLPNPWIVASIDRSLFEIACTVSIRKPEPALPEPEAATKADGVAAGYFDGAVDGIGDLTDVPIDTALTSGDGHEWQQPFAGKPNVTSDFGPRSRNNHKGIDFGLPLNSPIYATRAGTVTRADGTWDAKGYGNLVIIDHGGGFTSYYAHLSKIISQKGLHVEAGQIVGMSGGAPGAPGSGDATGPHLHFEIRILDRATDPQPLLDTVKFDPLKQLNGTTPVDLKGDARQGSSPNIQGTIANLQGNSSQLQGSR